MLQQVWPTRFEQQSCDLNILEAQFAFSQLFESLQGLSSWYYVKLGELGNKSDVPTINECFFL